MSASPASVAAAAAASAPAAASPPVSLGDGGDLRGSAGGAGLLAVDTSGAEGGLAYAPPGGGPPLLRRFAAGRGQEGRIFPLLAGLLEEGGAAPLALAACTGPGSFTGLRIGLAAAEGFALAKGLPLAGWDAFSVLRFAVAEHLAGTDGGASGKRDAAGQALWLVLDSKREERFVARYASVQGRGADAGSGPREDGEGEGGGHAAPPAAPEPWQAAPAEILAAFRAEASLGPPPLLAGDGLTPELIRACRVPEAVAALGRGGPLALLGLAAAEGFPQRPGPPPRPFYARPPGISRPKSRPAAPRGPRAPRTSPASAPVRPPLP